jgi:hypothetical protein
MVTVRPTCANSEQLLFSFWWISYDSQNKKILFYFCLNSVDQLTFAMVKSRVFFAVETELLV